MCEDSDFLKVFFYSKEALNIISILAPMVLIVLASIDIAKVVISDNNDALNLTIKRIVKRSIAAITIFFVPTFVNLLLDISSQHAYKSVACWTNATEEKLKYYEKETEERKKIALAEQEAEAKKREEEKKAKEELEKVKRLEEEKGKEEMKPEVGKEIFPAKKYGLNEDKIIKLAKICYKEQGSAEGWAAEASLMANLFEKGGKDTRKEYGSGIEGLYQYVRTSGWFANAETTMDNKPKPPTEVIAIVKDVLVNGNRTIPDDIVEHDCWFCHKKKKCPNGNIGDICKIIVNGKTYTSSKEIKNRSNYIKDKTIIYNAYGSIYKFYFFPSSKSDPFGSIIGYWK